MMEKNAIGKILWSDLTVENAKEIRDFYAAVIGWRFEPVNQGDYEDYNMINADGSIVSGICHNKGGNKNLPAQWLNYITVDSLSSSIAQVEKLGGEVVDGPRKAGNQQFAVIKDPAGAYFALFEE